MGSTVSNHDFNHLQKVLNMPATNFDTLCVSANYAMPNFLKDSRHKTDDSSFYFIRATRFSCVSTRMTPLATDGLGMYVGYI